ncbi:MAG: hypothetical protein AAF597_06685 [Bacteroidota bacterium]
MFRTLLFSLALLFSAALSAQEMHLLTQSDGSAVRLRWAIDDAADWAWANANGYTITRMTRKENGQSLSLGDQAASRETLELNYRPLGQSDWADDELSQAASQVLYGDWSSTNTDDFAAAAEAETNRENQLFFAHALAERDFTLAMNLALGYIDDSVEEGKEYVYVVTINGREHAGRAVNAGAKGGLGQGTDDLAPVDNLRVENGDTTVRVGWSTATTEHLYTSYDIYRAPSGGGAFVKANAVPFVYGASGPEDPKFAMFSDSLAIYGDYDYYVVGRTPFGLDGPPSDTLMVSSQPGPVNLVMRIDSAATTESAVTLHWQGVVATYNNIMVAQRVYRAASAKATYSVVGASLGVGDRTWTDPDPLPSAYYIVELEDENGHVYRTMPQAAQLEDLSPPAMPTQFAGQDEGSGSVILTWAANTEADLAGYRVFRCYARGGDFATVSVDVLTDTTFTDDLRGTIINDSIFYRLEALDNRGNASEKTPVLVVERVDITPPGKPTLARCSATPAGIAVEWAYSADEDVVRHELQRRPSGSASWTTVVIVVAGEEADFHIDNFDAGGSINYLDETDLPRGDYDYQFLAFDDAGLGAGSEIVTLRPHDSGERGEIRDLSVAFECEERTVITELDEARNKAIQRLLESYEQNGSYTEAEIKAVFVALEMSGLATATQFEEWLQQPEEELIQQLKRLYEEGASGSELTNCVVKLTWSYPLDPSIKHFQVYRSRKGSRLRPYRALPVEYFFAGTVPTGRQYLAFTDEDIQPGARYLYKVMAVHVDGGYSQEGSGVMVVVE